MNEDKWNQYLDLVSSMTLDARMGKFTSKETYISNLRMIANEMEEMNKDEDVS